MKRLLLTLVAGPVLWYLGHILTASVWTLLRLAPDSAVPEVTNLLLIPLAFTAAWLLLGWSRSRSPGCGPEGS